MVQSRLSSLAKHSMSEFVKVSPNKSLQPTRDGVSSSAIAENVIRPACLSSGR